MATDTERTILAEIISLRAEVNKWATNGCAHGWQHKDHGDRLLKLEATSNEVRGKAIASGGLIAIIASAFFAWLGRNV